MINDAVRDISKVKIFSAIFVFVRTPTTKAVGSELVTKFEPTALVVGVSKKMKTLDF
jgi:hypothetical protein